MATEVWQKIRATKRKKIEEKIVGKNKINQEREIAKR